VPNSALRPGSESTGAPGGLGMCPRLGKPPDADQARTQFLTRFKLRRKKSAMVNLRLSKFNFSAMWG
jgi:hypothetical protein